MKLSRTLLPIALFLFLAPTLRSQSPQPQPAQNSQPTQQHNSFAPLDKQAPGAGPDKVWLNENTKVYHCPGDRYYGRTKNGKYVTEPEAKAAGAHGPRGQTCFAK
jgi:hypothetical protein